MRCEILRHGSDLERLGPAWAALWQASTHRPATLHPAWVIAWWQVFGGAEGAQGALDGELYTVAAWQGRDLVGVAPFFVAPPRFGAHRGRELKVVGDQLVGLSQMLLAAPGEDGRVRDVVVEALSSEPSWDLLDVTLASRPGAAPRGPYVPGQTQVVLGSDVDGLALRFAAMGRQVERFEAHGRASLELGAGWDRVALSIPLPAAGEGLALRALSGEAGAAKAVLGELGRLLGETGAAPAGAGGERPPGGVLLRFLERALEPLVAAGAASAQLLCAEGAPAVAASVVLVDGTRRMELTRAGADLLAADRLAAASLRRASGEGAARFEFFADTPLSTGRTPGVRLRVQSRAASSLIERGYSSIMRRAAEVGESAIARVRAPLEDSLRALGDPSSAVGRAVARVATYSRMHLYRGELFVWRGAEHAPFAAIRLFSLADFEALSDAARSDFVARLDLDEGYARQKWERGDLVVAAFHGDRPAGAADALPVGILWCARGPVFVPEIGREVRPVHGECYIHDVFVAPGARGHAVAPAMLEFLARELRDRDIYRAWALIERTNTASTRAFEKATYASFADVIYARMGTASRLLVRPPDPEARRFLGA